MSFDMYLISFERQQPSGLPRHLVRDAFGEHLRWEDEESGWTRYSEIDGCSVLLSPLHSDPNLVSCVSINRPVSDDRFWTSLYRIMRLGNYALFFSGRRGPLVAELSGVDHLPRDILDSLGQPIVVHDGREIVEQIRSG
jgi:hypothetical protein